MDMAAEKDDVQHGIGLNAPPQAEAGLWGAASGAGSVD